MLFSIANNYVSHRKLKNIKAKAYKNRIYSSGNSSSSDLDFYSSLSSDSDREEERHPTEHKEINKLYHVMTDNIKKNKNQPNDAIENEPNLIINLVYLVGLITPYQ